MRLIFELNKYGQYQQHGSQICYSNLEALQSDIYRVYKVREMLIMDEKDGKPTKVKFDVKKKRTNQ